MASRTFSGDPVSADPICPLPSPILLPLTVEHVCIHYTITLHDITHMCIDIDVYIIYIYIYTYIHIYIYIYIHTHSLFPRAVRAAGGALLSRGPKRSQLRVLLLVRSSSSISIGSSSSSSSSILLLLSVLASRGCLGESSFCSRGHTESPHP